MPRPRGSFSQKVLKHKKKILHDLSLGHSLRAIAKRYSVAESSVRRLIDEADQLKEYRQFLRNSLKTEDYIKELKAKHEKLSRELERPPNVVELRQVVDPTIEVTEEHLAEIPPLQQVTIRAAIANQQLANQLLYRPNITRDDIKAHADITRTNSSAIDQTAKTMLNIQINNGETEQQQAIKAFPIPSDMEEGEVIDVIDEEEA